MDIRKRGRGEFDPTANGGWKRSKPEMDSLSGGIGSKSKPCTKFFSMTGCPFGENCHFLHHVPGGYKAVAQMTNLAPAPAPAPATKTAAGPLPIQNGSAPAAAAKTKLCNKYNSAEGCKFNDKCHFAHGEWELRNSIIHPQEDPHAIGAVSGHFGARAEPPVQGVNSKQICRQTGAKLSIREHETDPSLRNIELEGRFEQIKHASTMVREVIVKLGAGSGPAKTHGVPPTPGSNFKTKLCENFSKGSCTFGDRCHFAHGAAEQRKTGL